MSKISELFGLYCADPNIKLKKSLTSQLCPYTGRICSKMRKSDPKVKIGTCSVKFQNNDIIICPFRLLEHNQIFIDCLHLLTEHKPGNELYLIPEVKIPGGYVDYFLISAKKRIIKDFVGIELQTMDTTGTVWPDRQRFLHERGLAVDDTEISSSSSFGMNWKMTLKTILIQMHHKSEAFEHINKHLVLIIQKPLYDHMLNEFNFKDIKDVRLEDPIHIHSYDFIDCGNKFSLSLSERVSTDSEGIAKCLSLNADSKLELQDIISILEQKLTDETRLSIQLSEK